MCAAFLPNKDIDFIIKHKDIPGINYLRKNQINEKHLSINKIAASEKRLRKIKEIKHFLHANSIFKEFVPETENDLDRAFEIDQSSTKIKNFIKDQDDLQKTLKVLRLYYRQIKQQFHSAISDPGSYPAIEWSNFTNATKTWNIIDKVNLSQADIDRIFIATNYEEEDVEDNDDNSLCRYEVLEIITRMAKCKYYEKGHCPTIWEACQKMLVESIIPNTIALMDGQPFRETFLYNLNVDNLFKDNQISIQAIYRAFATNGITENKKFLSKDDVLRLGKEALLPLTEI